MTNAQMVIQERLADNSWGILGSQGYVLGIDLGGYGLRIALIDLQNKTYTSRHSDVTGTDPEAMLEKTLANTRRLLEEAGVRSNHLVRIGIGFGGPVDPDKGMVLLSPRMSGWENFSLKNYFEQAFDTVTLVDNDANLIALGEAIFGVGYECSDLFYLHLSSGVGGGIVLGNRIFHGATAKAGEIGHAIVENAWRPSNERATLEEMVSLYGLMRRARELGFETDNLEDIFSDHPIAQQVVQETTDLLALRLAHIVALLDPQMIVLGGIVARIGGDFLVQAIAEQVGQYIAPTIARPVHVVSSVLGSDSIAIGALALALESLQE